MGAQKLPSPQGLRVYTSLDMPFLLTEIKE